MVSLLSLMSVGGEIEGKVDTKKDHERLNLDFDDGSVSGHDGSRSSGLTLVTCPPVPTPGALLSWLTLRDVSKETINKGPELPGCPGGPSGPRGPSSPLDPFMPGCPGIPSTPLDITSSILRATTGSLRRVGVHVDLQSRQHHCPHLLLREATSLSWWTSRTWQPMSPRPTVPCSAKDLDECLNVLCFLDCKIKQSGFYKISSLNI
ncbi:hypothetical protein E2C01_014428 [Portunus trituberculatus]|uniref:Uncharacterized protein n=1 Tax=Portunus trituberculatus TaxID=210409 RepID=A0A5B7DIT0_PORTR|nr:hypothetical protein [Portunus trituberculatus]